MKVFFKTGRSARRDHARNQRESRRFRPQMDAMLMEPRLLMAAGPLGINLAGTLGFVDLMKQTAQNWTSLTSTPLTLDSHGWPQGDAQMLVFDERVNQSFNGPDPNAVAPDIGGTYHLSFQGKATVSADFPNNYTVQNQVYNAATNTTTADLIVQHNSLDMLYLDFRNTVNPSNTSTGAGVSNVKLIQPGYAADTTQVFTTNMLNDLAPFSVLRYLNIDQANNYIPTTDSSGKLVQVDWSQRKLPNAASQLTGSSLPGQAWEYQIALANATNTDMWINIPATASDSYVAQLASLFKNGDTIDGVYYAGLNSNLKVYLEDSNEVWGGIYQPFAANLIGAETAVANGDTALTSGGVNDPSIWAQRYYMQRTMQITNIFRSAMGSDPSYAKIRPVLGWQEGNDSYYTSNFAWFESSFGAPNQYFYGMGGAIYSTPTDYSSVTNLINSLSTSFASIAANTQILATTANYYGLKTVSYEGGPDAGGGQNTAQTQVALAAERDPRMEALIQQEYSIWFAAGGNLTMVYDGPYENWTPNNQYAVLEVAQAGNPTASAKYRGFLDLSLAAPTTVTAGTTVSATGPSSIPIASDSYGFAFPTFSSGQPNFWLLNVASAGSYSLIIQTGNSSSVGQVTISLSDSNTVGTYNLGSSGTYNLTNLTLHAGLNTLAISTNGSFVPTAVTLVPASSTSSGPILQDSGFESEILSSSTRYAYDPSGTAWTYAGSAGVSGNASSFTANNPNAPAGSQVAFLQNQGTLSQVLTGWAAGTYHLSFSAAQRAYFTAQSFQVLVDGAVVGTFTPSGSAYQSLATTSFAATAGSHTIMFKGLNASGDATAFVDSITLTQDTNAPVSTATVADPSFEQLAVGSGYAYDPTATPWTFAGTAGIAGNASAFTAANPAAPYGSQVAFLQNQGTLSQVLTGWAAGTYHLSFSAAQRAYYSTQSFQVLVDGAVVGTFTPSGSAYQALATTSFAATAGSHTIMFKGLNASGDATAFLDGITINQDNTTGATLGDPSFEQLAVGSGYAYDPTATPWTFASTAGIAGNASAFTAANPTAPYGSQVAFLQNQGTLSQAATFATGTYHLSFSAAQRANYAAQSFQVLVDGAVVGTFTPSGSAYQSLATTSFAATAGSHTIMFKGLNASGDATAFLDGITINQEISSSTSSTLADTGFEASNTPSGGISARPTGTPWTFTGSSGVSGNASGFTSGNPNAPQGSQVAFLQDRGAVSQVISYLTAGSYSIAFDIAQRGNMGIAQSVQVWMDGTVVGTFSPTSTSYQLVSTSSFIITAGLHQITFQGLDPSGDGTAFIDAVSLNSQTASL